MIKTIAYTSTELDGKAFIANSEGDSISSDNPNEILSFLAKNYGDSHTINRKVTWDLDDFMAIILRRLGETLCSKISQEPKCEVLFDYNSGELTFHDINEIPSDRKLPDGYFSMFYYKGSQVGLQLGSAWKTYIYNISQYYKDTKIEAITPNKLVELTQQIEDAGFKLGLRSMMRLGSAISLFEDNCLNHMEIPSISSIDQNLSDDNMDKLVSWCNELISRGAWVTNYAIGNWGKGQSYLYDLSSAYGYQLSRLNSIKYAKFNYSTTPMKEADDGVMFGKITINSDVRVSPISRRMKNKIGYPTGTWEDVFPLNQIRWVYRHKIGVFEMQEGIFWNYTAPVKPFEVPLNRIFDKRIEGGLVKTLAKQINAACWGKLIQKESKTGYIPFKNPIMAMQVKTATSLQIADFIYDNHIQDNVLNIATDSVRTDKFVSGIPSVSNMGGWRYEGDEPCLIMMPTGVATPTKKPQELYYDDILSMMQSNPNDAYYHTTIKRRITLKEALLNNALNKVGEIADFDKNIDMTSIKENQNNDYDVLPCTGGDLLKNKYYGLPFRA